MLNEEKVLELLDGLILAVEYGEQHNLESLILPLTTVKVLLSIVQKPDSAAVEPAPHLTPMRAVIRYLERNCKDDWVTKTAKEMKRYIETATNPQRITEQDARKIFDAYFNYVDTIGFCNLDNFNEWMDEDGTTILAKLNENREPDYKAAADELSNSSKSLLAIIESAGLINLSGGVQLGQASWYAKAIDAVSWCKAAIEKHEGWNQNE